MTEQGKSPQVTGSPGPKKRPTGRARTAAKLAAATSAASVTGLPGPVETSVVDLLAGLDELDATGQVMAATAVSLARTLDAGAGMSSAAIARELRATVHELDEQGADALFKRFAAPTPPSGRPLKPPGAW